MKKCQAIASTTHVDLHGERMSRKALESAAAQAKERYIPITLGHDIRHPPMGRIISAEVIQLQDGEYGLQTIGEIFESSDSIDSLTGDGREIAVEARDIKTIDFLYDRTFRDKEGQELVSELNRICGDNEKPRESVKKALEPVQTLIILGGIFIAGGIAGGFLSKLGSDTYDRLKNSLIRYYHNKNGSDNILDFCFFVRSDNRNIKVHVLVSSPTGHKIETLFSSKFGEIDAALGRIPISESSISEIVFEHRNGKLEALYAVRHDCVPLMLRKRKKKSNVRD